jgi:hypothetical protein
MSLVPSIRLIACTLCLATASCLAQDVVVEDWLRQEKVIRKRDAGTPAAFAELCGRATAFAEGLGSELPEASARLLGRIAKTQLAAKALPAGDAARAKRLALYLAVRQELRALSLATAATDFDQLLFVKRHWPGWSHQCSHRMGEAQKPGANLCVLDGLRPDGKVRELLTGEFAAGGIGRPDLSFDGTRIVFPFAGKRAKPTRYVTGQPGRRVGACHMYDLYEVAATGGTPRRLTNKPGSEDTEPFYLPDGRIGFSSSRGGQLVQCGDWALACGLYTMAADGSDLRRITEPKEGEFYPSMLADGRILYTRWDYVMKGFNVIQQLWSVYPDGRGARLVYGDHYAFSRGPITFQEARQIPGTSQILCVGHAHHNQGIGPVLMVDLARHRDGARGMRNLTPWVAYPEMSAAMLDERGKERVELVGDHRSGWYSSPWPLSSTQYLACYSFERNAAADAYGIYLMDRFGNQELILRLQGSSCYSPIPLRPRPVPRVFPDLVRGAQVDSPAVCVLQDVQAGLKGVAPGTVKYIRVLETRSKLVHTVPQRVDVGVNSGWDVRGVLGTVPVAEDGSACFEIPAGKQIFFEALDKDFLEVRRMRNFLNAQPGETVGCVGCHEANPQTPSHAARSLRQAPQRLTPPPWKTTEMGFRKRIQPILDARCIRCHDGATKRKSKLDLRPKKWVEAPRGINADQGPQHLVTAPFLGLLGHVRYIRVGGYQGEKLPLAPYATGSAVSPLMARLRKGHGGIAVGSAEWRAFAAWIDCNAPFLANWDDILTIQDLPPDPPDPRPLTAAEQTRIKQRRTQLAASGKLLTYVNLGVAVQDAAPTGETLQHLRGKPWIFGNKTDETTADRIRREIIFDSYQVILEAAGLKPDRTYTIGLSWWDYDGGGRVQGVYLAKPDTTQRGIQLLPPARLPNAMRDKQPAQELRLILKPEHIVDGRARLLIPRDGGANAVVSEIWLVRE